MLPKFSLKAAAALALAAAAMLGPGAAKAQPAGFDADAVADSLRAVLAQESTGKADSLDILIDLFDLSPRSQQTAIAEQANALAYELGDFTAGLDMLRHMANINTRSDSILSECLRLALRWPKTADRDETVCFIKILQNYRTRSYAPQEEKLQTLQTMMDVVANDPPSNIYDHICMLHNICINLADVADYSLQTKYINTLDSLISWLRPEAYPLRNAFLVQASLAYHNSDMEKHKSMAYDLRLLDVIDAMERGDEGYNRKYRNYDGNRYVIYTRLLSNYDSLPAPKFEEYYAKAMQAMERSAAAAATNQNSLRPQIYRAAKYKDYPELHRLLAAAIDLPHNSTIRPSLLRLQIEAAQALGDQDALLKASLEYNKVLEKQIEESTLKKWRELEILYDLERTKTTYESKRLAMQRYIIVGALVAVALLLVLLIVTYCAMRRARRLAASVEFANEQLTTERDNLRLAKEQLAKARDAQSLANATKKAFIRNFTDEVKVPLHTINEYTHLIIGGSEQAQRPYLKEYADKVLLNSEMVTVLLRDLTTLAQIDNNSIKPATKPQSLARICADAIDAMHHRLAPGVEIELESGPDLTVDTDALRLRHILWQLLTNAAKFTRSGSISVAFKKVGSNAEISITDTGIGIDPANAERIFERFVKLDRTVQGAGIGLPIARQLAEILGGTLRLDTTHSPGARFVITIPMQ